MTAAVEKYDDDGRYLGKDRDGATPLDIEAAQQEESFEDFWAEYSAGTERKQVDIFGVLVDIPHDIPLAVTVRAEQSSTSTKFEDVKHLVGMVFDEDLLGEWVDRGITHPQFEVILAWAMANGAGRPTTFREAAKTIAEETAKKDAGEDAGKAQVTPMNRAERRAAARQRGYRSSAAGR